jgi:RND family efflux transporter MFP subunit
MREINRSTHRAARALATALVGVALVAGCRKAAAPGAETGTAPAPVVVGPENIAVAADTTLSTGPTLSGSLAPELAANVRAEVAGSVVEVDVDAGQQVKKGAVLGRIDDTALRDAWLSARAALRSAESSAQLAQRNSERSARLNQAGAVADRDLEQAQNAATTAEGQVADARARLATAEKQLAKTVVRAPFDGIVAEASVSEGDVVQSGGQMFSVLDPRTMRLDASVPAEQVAAVRVGTPVQFSVTGYGDRRFTGNITRVSPAVDPTTRQVRVIVALPNAERTLVAGLFADGHVATDRHEGIVVPRAAVDTRGLRPVAVRLRDGRLERVEVELGLEDRASERVEVTKGLAAGDTLLVGTPAGLPANTIVRVRQDEAAAAGKR